MSNRANEVKIAYETTKTDDLENSVIVRRFLKVEYCRGRLLILCVATQWTTVLYAGNITRQGSCEEAGSSRSSTIRALLLHPQFGSIQYRQCQNHERRYAQRSAFRDQHERAWLYYITHGFLHNLCVAAPALSDSENG